MPRNPRISGWCFVMLVVLAPCIAHAAQPEFEVASIKPNTSGSDRVTWGGEPRSNRFTATNINLRTLIKVAYKLKDSEITGGPGWIDFDRYDIAAKPPESNPSLEDSRLMLQALLADRFKLMTHREVQEIPVYALRPAGNGTKLPKSREGTCIAFGADGHPPPQPPGQSPLTPCEGFVSGPGLLAGGRASMQEVADVLGNILDRPVVDKTGYDGMFNVRLEFAPGANADTSGPSIFTAMREQLGLKLESQKASVQILVIDRIERAPTEN